MKKLITIFLTFVALSGYGQTKTPAQKGNYYYYPAENVYYNINTKNFSYYNTATAKWTNSPQLPTSLKITNTTPKTSITYAGTQVWIDNAAHRAKYGPVSTTPVPSTPATTPIQPSNAPIEAPNTPNVNTNTNAGTGTNTGAGTNTNTNTTTGTGNNGTVVPPKPFR